MMQKWIWQREEWPDFTWNNERLLPLLSRVSREQGLLLGTVKTLGFDVRMSTALENMTEDILRSSEIEGVMLNSDRVRSSIARKLGIPTEGLPEPDHYTEGVVQVMMEALQHADEPFDEERLFQWHEALFPTGRSGGHRIAVAQWRQGEEPMQVVSGAMGKEKVHYEAPPSDRVASEMDVFFHWLNTENQIDPVLKAAVAHLWFVLIHPMDDGNGRMTRTLSDVLLARADGMPHRFYSMSAAILNNRKSYYNILERMSSGILDITEWLSWFLQTLEQAIRQSDAQIVRVLQKAAFWEKHREVALNERQIKIINRMWNGLEGVMNTGKWAKMTHVSQDTALRDIDDLIQKGVLRKNEGGGRSTSYTLAE